MECLWGPNIEDVKIQFLNLKKTTTKKQYLSRALAPYNFLGLVNLALKNLFGILENVCTHLIRCVEHNNNDHQKLIMDMQYCADMMKVFDIMSHDSCRPIPHQEY